MTEEKERQFTVWGAEDVCDAFDDYEQTNSLGHIVVSAKSIDEAVKMGNSHFYGKVRDEREAGGFMSSGSFTGYVDKVYNSEGKLVYEYNLRE